MSLSSPWKPGPGVLDAVQTFEAIQLLFCRNPHFYSDGNAIPTYLATIPDDSLWITTISRSRSFSISGDTHRSNCLMSIRHDPRCWWCRASLGHIELFQYSWAIAPSAEGLGAVAVKHLPTWTVWNNSTLVIQCHWVFVLVSLSLQKLSGAALCGANVSWWASCVFCHFWLCLCLVPDSRLTLHG